MKGTPEAPACGFSARTVAALQALDVPFAAVDILPDPRIRQELSAISNWPTIPQLFANGELVGGCDIVTEMYESGELAERVASKRRSGLGERRCSRVPRRVRPVAIVTDSTDHYLPRALADSEGIHQVSLYVGWTGRARRELEMDDFDAFYERLRARSRAADDLAAVDRRLPRRLGAAARGRAGTSSRSTSPAASPAPARRPARRTGCSPSAASASASR